MVVSYPYCIVASHGGPAAQMAASARDPDVYALGEALKKFQAVESITKVTDISKIDESERATTIAKLNSKMKAVLVDGGHEFSYKVLLAFKEHAPHVTRILYYDNPDAYVPGGWSKWMAKSISVAQKVLFANASLTAATIYETKAPFDAEDKTISLDHVTKEATGYYAIDVAEKVALRRIAEYKRTDGVIQIGYAGGNNEECFTKAFPAMLQIFSKAMKNKDLSNVKIFIHQHPGAVKENRDGKMVEQWKEINKENAPEITFITTAAEKEDGQVSADVMLYFQTSMAPQFVLAGIPTAQIGHVVFEDCIVSSGCVEIVTNQNQFLNLLQKIERSEFKAPSKDRIKEAVGYREDYKNRFQKAIGY
jgi:hypothetical protein